MIGSVRTDTRSRREHALGWLAERDRNDALSFGEAFARAQKERDAGPSPVVDRAAQCDESLGLGLGVHALLRAITVVLGPHYISWLDRQHASEYLVVLFADRRRLQRGRRFHGGERQNLEQV